jgi:hypothetical protein
MGELAPILTDDEINRLWRIGSALAKSKMFNDAQQAEEAFAKIILGRDLGLSPMQSMTGIHLVKGKPQVAAVMLAGFVRQHERYDYSIMEHTETACEILFWVDGDEAGTSRFTIEEAERAGLTKPSRNGEPSNWVKWPRNMLFARAMSNGVKWYAPDSMGGMPIYTEGDTLEGTATELAIGSGAGNGEGVGWQGLSDEDIAAAERVIERAQEIGHAGLSDRASIEMRLNNQSAETVEAWLAWATTVLADAPDPDARREALEHRRTVIKGRLQEGVEPSEFETLEAELQEVERELESLPTPGQESLL